MALLALHLQDHSHSAEHDFQVEPQRLVLDVIQIVLQFHHRIFDSGTIAIADLRPTGEARFGRESRAIERNLALQLANELRTLGARADHAHLTLDDVPRLRQLIDTSLADEAPHARDAVVILGGPFGLAIALGVLPHGTKLHHLELFAMQSHAILRVEDRARGIQLDGERNEGQADEEDNAEQQPAGEIQRALANAVKGAEWVRFKGQCHIPLAADVFDGHFAGELLIEQRHGRDGDAALVAIHDRLKEAALYLLADGDDDLVDGTRLDDIGHGMVVADDWRISDAGADLAGVVIDEADEVEDGMAAQNCGDGAAGVACAQDDHAPAGVRPAQHDGIADPPGHEQQGAAGDGDGRREAQRRRAA